jgi:hypothetical protein
VSEAAREILRVLALALAGLLLAGVVALTPWHPRPAGHSAVVEVHPPGR